MTRQLVVEPTGFGLRGAVLDGDRLLELLDVDTVGEAVTDGLFQARVDKLDRQLGAAFLDIGPGAPGVPGGQGCARGGRRQRAPADRPPAA